MLKKLAIAALLFSTPVWAAQTIDPNPQTGTSIGVGAPDIPTVDHDINADLQPSWGSGSIPPYEAVLGAFRFICRPTNVSSDDSTVFPNQPGASHYHEQTGAVLWNAYSNYVNLRTGAGGSGCNDVEGQDKNPAERTFSANRTPYYQPALFDGLGHIIRADYTSFYYKLKPWTGPYADPAVSNPAYAKYQGQGVPLPNGLKIVFGPRWDATLQKYVTRSIIETPVFGCIDPQGHPVTTDGTMDGAVACVKAHNVGLTNPANGYQFKVSLSAPDCWNGTNLDSPDHRSHMAYVQYGNWGYPKCPAGYGYVPPTFTYAAFYTILPTDTGHIHFSSDEAHPDQADGSSFHVDYGPASWDPVVLNMWITHCGLLSLNCSGGDLGNGKQLKGAAVPIYNINGVYTKSMRIPASMRLMPIPARGMTVM